MLRVGPQTKMAEDNIVRQAALRHHRRPARSSTFPRDESMEDSAFGSSVDYPSTQDQRFLTDQDCSTVPNLHSMRRAKYVDRHLMYLNTAFCLPFILCKFHTREAKALINTCVLTSIINRRDVPDLVLGLDFFTQLECALDFGSRQFIVRKEPQVSTTLLCERELPQRYRNGHNLLASF